MINNLQIKSIYSTDVDDIANDFYIPLLSGAKSYKRVSGYFSSSALALFATGIEELIYNKGTYRLLISNQLSKEDFELIRSGYLNRESFERQIANNLSDYSNLSAKQKKNFANVAYLIEIKVMDIKVGFTHEGLFHSKYGIISDESNNKVYFSGSLNETRAAFLNNYESITVVKSWNNENDNQTICYEEEHFDELWNNNVNNFIFVKEFNEILYSSIMQYSKGKIVMDSALMTEDALILYYETNQLKIEDNLTSMKVDETERRIKKLKNRYLHNRELWKFKTQISYKDIEDILKIITDYGRRTGTKIVVSDSVYNFIESQRFEIDDISNRGMMIKNKDSSLNEKFNQFNQIVSNELARNLRPIQSWVSFYMATMRRVGNFSVPGSGKTAMVYGTYAYLSASSIDEVDQIIMIGPKSSFKSWKDEFQLVFQNKRKLSVLDIHSDDFHPSKLSMNVKDYNLILINYDSVKKYQESLKSLINSRTMLVFDEVHKIKRIDGIKANAALELAQQAKYRYVLTGTPIPNGYQDVWNFLHILYQDEYMSYFGVTKLELQNMDFIAMEKFNEKLFPFYWRVTKNDLGVPPVNKDNMYVEIATPQEQKIIDLLWRKYSHSPFALYTRLIQFSSNPMLLTKNIEKTMFIDDYNDNDGDENTSKNNLTFEYDERMNDEPNYTSEELTLIESVPTSSKFESAILKADNLVQERKTVLIWCIFVDTMHKVVSRLKSKGHRVALIYGGISASEREQIITDFQNANYDILVTNPHTLAESVSLHNICHDAIYLEYSFNLTHMLQSRDRIHRLGLKDTDETNYYYFALEGENGKRSTIDKKIYYKLKEKEKIMIDSIEGTHIGVDFSIDEKEEIINMINEELEES